MLNKPLVKTIFYFKGALPFIPKIHMNLMVAIAEIYFKENRGSMKVNKKITQSWNWEAVLNCDSINGPTLYAQSP